VRPAGFGKTALLADWARRGDRSVAWLSLDAADNDPARFWRHAVAALDRARPGIAGRAGPLLGPPAPSSFEGLVIVLINELAAQPGGDEMLLVLDDYHLIDAQQVHTPLMFLLEHPPPGLRLVLASRSDPPLPLARLRAGGQLAELRTAELRFTSEEAAALLREAAGPGLPGVAVAALAARTEGWAAGLQLAALSLRGQPDPSGFVAAFGGSHRYVLDYLAGEVLDRQPEQVRGFLLETSVLERLSGALCDAVTGRAGSQAMLEAIEGAGLFLVPLDEVPAGGVTTTCSPTCCAPGCSSNGPAGSLRCTGPRRPGARTTTWPTTPCGTRWPPGTPPGQPGSSNVTSTRSSCRVSGRRYSGGFPRSPLTWSGPVRG
jgi:LuxR family maltose regulon positive regulatory protein